ncbi:MAG TPA: SOS response-associated peptidase [Candidatus Deferrimicrobium sp.]|nr:SOS response-associated peptidase [Candidatus Deferrimicrobium sp.]
MCGRYTLAQEHEQLQLRFGFAPTNLSISSRYNVAPGQDMPVITGGESRTLQLMRWGLVPFWAKDEKIGDRMINARAETVHEKPSFRRLLKERRCLIPADGYYEWKKLPGQTRKSPMRFIVRGGELFAFAGLWDVWRRADGSELLSYTIITTDANELSKPIHHRMPVILSQNHESVWLDSGISDPEQLTPLLRPFPSEEMEAYEVDTIVNSPKNDRPECVAKVQG